VLVALGAHNRLRVVPGLGGGSDDEPAARFRRVSRAELVTAAAVLAATAVLTGLAPGASTAAAARAVSQRVVVSASDYATTVTVELTVTPGSVGANRFEAQVDRYGTTAPAPARAVTLEFTLPSHPGIGAELELSRAGGGSWIGRGLQLSLPGTWRVEAVIRQATTAVVIPLSVRVAPR